MLVQFLGGGLDLSSSKNDKKLHKSSRYTIFQIFKAAFSFMDELPL